MPTKDGFDPAHALPRFLAAQAEQDTGHALDRAAPASRTFKASILIAAAAAAIGIAVLAAGDPMALLAEGSAWLVGNSPSQPTPTIQSATDAPALALSAADAEPLPPIAKDALTRDDVVASEPAAKDQAENSESASDALFRQFQAWAAEQEAQQPRGEPVPSVQSAPAQVVQDAPAPAAANVRAPHRLVQKRRQVRAVRDARAEVRTQNLRKQVRRVQGERAERPPVDARAQDQSAQNTEAPSFLSTFGLRN
jgi:hypothetical protein